VTEIVSWLSSVLDDVERVAQRACASGVTPEPWRPGVVYGTVFSDAVNVTVAFGRTEAHVDHIAANDPAHVLRTVAAHWAILAEHQPTLRAVEWPHDTTGKGEALTCPRCQNAEHTEWHPPVGMAGVLPEGFVAPYVLAPCDTLRHLVSIYADRPGYDPSWAPED
jgi:hypothetical protein